MSFTSGNTDKYDLPLVKATQQLHDIDLRLSKDISSLVIYPKFGNAAMLDIRRCLKRLRELGRIPGAAISKSQIKMSLQDLAESSLVDDGLRREARTLQDRFSDAVLGDKLIHWAPDAPAIWVALPVADEFFCARDALAPSGGRAHLLLRFDVLKSSTGPRLFLNHCILHQHSLLQHRNPPDQFTAPLVRATDSSLSDLAHQNQFYKLAIYTTISNTTLPPLPPANVSSSLTSISIDVLAAHSTNAYCNFFPRSSSCAFVPLDDPTQRVVQIQLQDGMNVHEVRLVERTATLNFPVDDPQGWGCGDATGCGPGGIWCVSLGITVVATVLVARGAVRMIRRKYEHWRKRWWH